MQRNRLLSIYHRDQRLEVRFPDMRRDLLPRIIRLVNVSGTGDGLIVHSQLDEQDVESAIQAQILFFERIGQSFEWKVYDYDTPADLIKRLAAAGFAIEEPESIMVLELDEGHPLLLRSRFPDVRRLSSPSQVTDVMAVERAVWNEELMGLAKFLTDCLRQNPAGVRIYGVYCDGRPVSVAWALFSRNSVFATLWGGSTLPAFRGRGYYSALLSIRAQEAWRRGVRFLAVDASAMSRPILEKHGFVKIAEATPCKWPVGSQPRPAGAD